MMSVSNPSSESVFDPNEVDEEVVRRLYEDRFGVQGAAWLIFKHRRKLHRRGYVDISVPNTHQGKSYEIPMWFSCAMGFLRRRQGWAVDVLRQGDGKMFRIRWFAWGARAKCGKVPPMIAGEW